MGEEEAGEEEEEEGEVVITLAGVVTRWDIVGERARLNSSGNLLALYTRLDVNVPLVLVGSCTPSCS